MRSLQVELLYPKVSLVEHKEAKQLNFECLHHEESVVEQKLQAKQGLCPMCLKLKAEYHSSALVCRPSMSIPLVLILQNTCLDQLAGKKCETEHVGFEAQLGECAVSRKLHFA